MSSDSQNEDFPTIRLDEEDRRDYQHKKQSSSTKPASAAASPKSHENKKSGFPVMASLSFIIALAACGGCYYLYDLSLKQALEAQSADARIAQLERKLSATDEEMGESTVALQVKVNELSEKSTELWEQMDKLWASAWRRNQKEIADLGARVTTVKNGFDASIKKNETNLSAQKSVSDGLGTRINTLSDDILALNVQLEQISEDKNKALQTNKTLQEQLAIVEQRNAALAKRITQLETEIKALATSILTPNTTP